MRNAKQGKDLNFAWLWSYSTRTWLKIFLRGFPLALQIIWNWNFSLSLAWISALLLVVSYTLRLYLPIYLGRLSLFLFNTFVADDVWPPTGPEIFHHTQEKLSGTQSIKDLDGFQTIQSSKHRYTNVFQPGKRFLERYSPPPKRS